MSGSRIYIGRLSGRANKKDVEKFFKEYGDIREINLKNGFGFVEFKDYRDAEDAVKDCNGREFFDHRIIVEIAKGERRGRRDYDRRDYDRRRSNNAPQRTNNRVYVEHISSEVSWQDLKDFFRRAGRVTFADAHKRNEGEGIVEFESYDDVKEALHTLDGAELKGQKIYLRDGSRRYSSSRRYSRSRSRSRKRSYSRGRYSPRRSDRSSRRSRSRSSRSRSRSASRTRSRSRSRSRSDSRSSRFREQSRSRSPSQGYNDKDNNNNNENRSRSRSRSPSRSPSQRSQRSPLSPTSRSPSRSRSPSKSPERQSANSPRE